MVIQGLTEQDRMRASDRVFKLQVIDGKKPTSSTGMIDRRLFEDGENANRLHAKSDSQTGLWSFNYEKGAIPEGLAGQWTGFQKCKDYAEGYFARRNIKITEVIG